MNQDFYSQETARQLANPTPYHLQQREQRELRNKKQFSSDGTPGATPTPNISYQNNLLNSFADSTIDPQILNRQQLPLSDSSGGSPQNHSYGGSPQSHIYGAGADDTFGRSFKPPSHFDSLFESSNSSLYSPIIEEYGNS